MAAGAGDPGRRHLAGPPPSSRPSGAALAASADLKAAGVRLLTGPGTRSASWARRRHKHELSWWETRPLFGWTVLVPRTREQAGAMSELLAAAGARSLRGADHRRRAAAHPGTDGACPQGPGLRALPVDRVHLRQRGEGHPREARRVRPRRARVRRREGRRGRRGHRRGAARLRHPARPGAERPAVLRGAAGRLAGLRRPARPDRPRAAAARRHRHRDAGRRAARSAAGRSTTSRRTGPCAPRRRPRRSARRSRAAGSTPCCSPRPRRCATWSASPASRTSRPCSPSIGPQTAQTMRDLGLRVDVQSRRARPCRRWWPRWPSTPSSGGQPAARHAPVARSGELLRRRQSGDAMSAGFPGRRGRAGCAGPRRCVGWWRDVRPDTGGPGPADVRQGRHQRAGADRSMPGVVQHTRESLRKAAVEAVVRRRRRADPLRCSGGQGRPRLRRRRPAGHRAARALADLAAEVGDAIVLMTDCCLDEYTDHGHCGLLTATGEVDNDATLERYASAAVAQAGPGRQVIAPSGMMDGQVGGDPRRSRRRRASGRRDLAPTASKYSSRVLRAVPRRRRVRAAVR